MPSYCSLAALKTYLNVSTSTDDDLIQTLLDASSSRIDSFTGRTYHALADTVRYFDPSRDVDGYELYFDQDISHVTSVVNGDAEDVTTSLYFNPRNETPYYKTGFKESMSSYWTYTTDPMDAIAVTGRWAYLHKARITALSRATNVVTATVHAPHVSVGDVVMVVDVADTTFNGTFTVLSNTGTAITWAQTAANDTDTTGKLLFAPPDIVMACKRLASWLYRQKDTQQGDSDRPILAGDGSIIMPSTLPQDVTTLLKPYIRVVR